MVWCWCPDLPSLSSDGMRKWFAGDRESGRLYKICTNTRTISSYPWPSPRCRYGANVLLKRNVDVKHINRSTNGIISLDKSRDYVNKCFPSHPLSYLQYPTSIQLLLPRQQLSTLCSNLTVIENEDSVRSFYSLLDL